MPPNMPIWFQTDFSFADEGDTVLRCRGYIGEYGINEDGLEYHTRRLDVFSSLWSSQGPAAYPTVTSIDLIYRQNGTSNTVSFWNSSLAEIKQFTNIKTNNKSQNQLKDAEPDTCASGSLPVPFEGLEFSWFTQGGSGIIFIGNETINVPIPPVPGKEIVDQLLKTATLNPNKELLDIKNELKSIHLQQYDDILAIQPIYLNHISLISDETYESALSFTQNVIKAGGKWTSPGTYNITTAHWQAPNICRDVWFVPIQGSGAYYAPVMYTMADWSEFDPIGCILDTNRTFYYWNFQPIYPPAELQESIFFNIPDICTVNSNNNNNNNDDSDSPIGLSMQIWITLGCVLSAVVGLTVGFFVGLRKKSLEWRRDMAGFRRAYVQALLDPV